MIRPVKEVPFLWVPWNSSWAVLGGVATIATKITNSTNSPISTTVWPRVNPSHYIDCMNSRQGCYDQFKDFTISKGKKMGVWSIIASAVCLINMVMICCICYHPAHRDRKRQNFYARMMQWSKPLILGLKIIHISTRIINFLQITMLYKKLQ